MPDTQNISFKYTASFLAIFTYKRVRARPHAHVLNHLHTCVCKGD